MDQMWVISLTLFIFFTLLFIFLGKTKNNQPPSPLALPIIGHLHLLQQPLHRFLQELSYKYGPIYSLKFGTRPVIVISSPTIVQECFTKHDIILANRPRLLVGKHLNYDWTTLGAASYGPLWRFLRRVTTMEFFSITMLNSLVDIRSDEVKSLVKDLFKVYSDLESYDQRLRKDESIPLSEEIRMLQAAKLPARERPENETKEPTSHHRQDEKQDEARFKVGNEYPGRESYDQRLGKDESIPLSEEIKRLQAAKLPARERPEKETKEPKTCHRQDKKQDEARFKVGNEYPLYPGRESYDQRLGKDERRQAIPKLQTAKLSAQERPANEIKEPKTRHRQDKKQDETRQFVKVQMRDRFSELSFNIVMRMVTGKRYFEDDLEGVKEAKEFKGIIRDVFELSGAANPMDFFPWLWWFDFGNIEKKMLKVKGKMDEFLECLIEDCKRDRKSDGVVKKALIYKLLDMQEVEPHNYSNEIIKGIIMIMLTAGTDTTSVTMEWALSLLLNHPTILHNARSQIQNQIGNHRLVQESDLSNLESIENIINETLRLFPAVPLLSPHEPSQDCIISGHHVKRGTMVLINAWAIQRDTNLWEDALVFKPERFKGIKNDEYRLKLLPFGLGRRSCPGVNLANKMVGLVLGTLIQCFDWEKVGDVDVDLVEGIGLSMPKANPLEVMCRPCPSMVNVLSKI